MRNLLFLCALVAPAMGLACGGLFCSTGPGAAPVDQTAERILFEVDDDRICTTVEIAYTGAPEAFAWLVPVPELPEVGEGDATLLRTLAAATDLQWRFPRGDNIDCPYFDEAFSGSFGEPSGCGGNGCEVSEEGGGLSGLPETDIPPPDVQVFGREQTENYETATIGAERASELVRWLEENDYNVSENMVPVMQPYVDEGMAFLAIKLRAGRTTSQIAPLRFCYRAAAPMIPLRLTAVAAQPQMSIQVFVAAYTLFSPAGAQTRPPDAEVLAFDPWGNVNYAAWLAREAGQREGRFWAVEYAGPTPEVTLQDLPDGRSCIEDWSCERGFDCTYVDANFTDARCVRECWDRPCPGDEVCLSSSFCVPPPRRVSLPPWLTRFATRMGPELMDHDPIFVATPERPAYDGVVDLSRRAPVEMCYEPLPERLPSPCAFAWCGLGARCVHEAGRTDDIPACACPAGQVAVAVPQPDGFTFAPTCVPEENPVGVLPGDAGDPCAAYDCGEGECVPRGGFPTCRCRGRSFAYATFGEIRCAEIDGEITSYAEGAGPDAGNRDDAPITTPDPRRPGLPAIAFGLLVAAGLLRRGRR